MSLVDPIRDWFQALTVREQRLVTTMFAVLCVMLVILPMVLTLQSISEMEDGNLELAAVIRDIERRRPELEQAIAEREAAEARYRRPIATGLGTFLTERANSHHITLGSTTPQPDLEIQGFTRKMMKVDLEGVELRDLVKMLGAIEASPHPVAITHLEIDNGRRRGGGDGHHLVRAELVVATYIDPDAEPVDPNAPPTPDFDRAPRPGMRPAGMVVTAMRSGAPMVTTATMGSMR